MPFIAATDTWRVAINYSSDIGQVAANVIHVYDGLGDMSGGRADDLCDLIRAWAVSDWDAVANDSWTMGLILAVDAGSQTGASGSNATPTAGVGTGDPLPGQDTITMSLRTGAIGRSQRGRLYHVGLSEGSLVNGLVDLTSRTNLINAYLALASQLAVEDLYWSVASFYTNGAPRATAQIRTITDIVIVDAYVDRQLRRKQ